MNYQHHIKFENGRKKICIHFGLLLVFAFAMLIGIMPVHVHAQSDTSPYGAELADSSDTSSAGLKARFNAMAAQMLDNEAFASALRCSRLCKIGSWNIYGNSEQKALSDTLLYLRQARQCEVYFKCIVNYRSAYPKVLNKKTFQPTLEDLESHFSELYKKELFIDLQLIPLWDTAKMRAEDAKTAKVPLWKVAFNSRTTHSEIDTSKINHIFRTHFAGKQFGSFQDKENENRPDKIIRKALLEVVGKLLDGADTISFDASIDHVTFTDAGDSKYGFDAWDEGNSAIKGQYETLQLNGKEYVIPYKSVAVNNTDKINAQAIPRVKDGAVTDSLEFSMGSLKATIESQKNLKNYQLQLPSKTMEGSEQLSAIFTLNDKTYDAGFVNVVGYPAKTFEVVLVPVENKTGKGSSSASRVQVKTALDSIYAQAAVSWTVSEDDPIKVPDIDLQNFNAGDNQLLSKYTDDMQLLVKTYKKERKNYDKNKYYVFLIPNSNKAGLYARMPLTSNFGFFFTKNLTVADKMAHTIAHELGHGAFHLYHTFSDKNQYTQTRGNTNNLMDYDNNLGSHLYKYQWDLVHDPESMLFSFMEDETESETSVPKDLQ
ncbi:MAG: hypothetical protein MI922_06870, partial [Bacteroidales bacterium]|nr:hypothetical protein [Bacteroidales bacterium]